MQAGIGGDGFGVVGGCADEGRCREEGRGAGGCRGVGFIRLVRGTTYCIGHKSSFPTNLSFKQIIPGGGDASAILQLSRGGLEGVEEWAWGRGTDG